MHVDGEDTGELPIALAGWGGTSFKKSAYTGEKLDYIFIVLCPTQTEGTHRLMQNILNLCVNMVAHEWYKYSQRVKAISLILLTLDFSSASVIRLAAHLGKPIYIYYLIV